MIIEPLISSFLSLAMDTSSLNIVVFSDPTSLGVSLSYLFISIFTLNESSTPISPSDSSNFSFPSLIRLWTLHLSELQFSVE